MRNVDKIKDLRYELGRWQKKVADQQKEIAKLKKDRDKGLAQLEDMFRAVLTAMAVGYGREAPEGTYTIELPVASVTGNKINFDTTVDGQDAGTCVVRAVQKAAEK